MEQPTCTPEVALYRPFSRLLAAHGLHHASSPLHVRLDALDHSRSPSRWLTALFELKMDSAQSLD
jgi:hypothetical protein